MSRIAAHILFLASLLVTACGCSEDDKGTGNNPPEEPSEVYIGPQGGELAISGAVILRIPAGALSDSVGFTIQETTSPVAHADTINVVSPVFSIVPSGTIFSQPCSLTISYEEQLLSGTDESLLEMGVYSDGWSYMSAEVDETANTATAEVTHLSDFTVVEYVRTAGGLEFSAALDASVPGIKFYTKLQDNLFWLLQFIDYRLALPVGMTYSRETGNFAFQIDLGDDGVFSISGRMIGAPVEYIWQCLEMDGTTCVDSIQVASGTGPPEAWADGIHNNDIGICSWQATSDTLFALGTFSIRGLSNETYWLTLVAPNRLYLSDTSMFYVPMLGYSWNLSYFLPAETHWRNDTTFVWPTGTMEFVTKITGDPDSLYAHITFGMNVPTGNIWGSYGADTADASIDWETFVIGD